MESNKEEEEEDTSGGGAGADVKFELVERITQLKAWGPFTGPVSRVIKKKKKKAERDRRELYKSSISRGLERGSKTAKTCRNGSINRPLDGPAGT